MNSRSGFSSFLFSFQLLLLGLCLLTLFPVSGHCIPDPMEPPRLVNDFAHLLAKDERDRIEKQLRTFAAESSAQIYVVTVNSLEGMDPLTFATKIGNAWGVGQANIDNGVVLLVKPKTSTEKGQVGIALGKGVEKFLTNQEASGLIENSLIPLFKREMFAEGIQQVTYTLQLILNNKFQASSAGNEKVYNTPRSSSAHDKKLQKTLATSTADDKKLDNVFSLSSVQDKESQEVLAASTADDEKLDNALSISSVQDKESQEALATSTANDEKLDNTLSSSSVQDKESQEALATSTADDEKLDNTLSSSSIEDKELHEKETKADSPPPLVGLLLLFGLPLVLAWKGRPKLAIKVFLAPFAIVGGIIALSIGVFAAGMFLCGRGGGRNFGYYRHNSCNFPRNFGSGNSSGDNFRGGGGGTFGGGGASGSW